MGDAFVAAICAALAVMVAPADGRAARGTDPCGALVGLPARGARRTEGEEPDREDVAAALVLLALAFRSGLPTPQVLEAVASVLDRAGASDDGPLHPAVRVSPFGGGVSRDLRQVAAALHWGAADAEAWGSVGEVWSGAARAVAIAHRAGLPPGPLLLSAADELRREALEGLELAAARVGVRLVAPLGLVLLPAFGLTTVVPLVAALGRQLLAG